MEDALETGLSCAHNLMVLPSCDIVVDGRVRDEARGLYIYRFVQHLISTRDSPLADPWGPEPPSPQDSFKIMQFSGNFKGRTSF